MKNRLLVCAIVVLAAGSANAAEALELKLIAKKDSYTLETGGKSAKDYQKMLEDIAALMKNRQKAPQPPRPPAVDFVLQVKNTSKNDIAITVEGDSNLVTFEVKGPGVIELRPLLAFTADFRIGKTIKLDAGQSYEFPVKALSDGFRGMSRWIYWTMPGEYTITASYQLANAEGGKGAILKSEPIKVKIEEKK